MIQNTKDNQLRLQTLELIDYQKNENLNQKTVTWSIRLEAGSFDIKQLVIIFQKITLDSQESDESQIFIPASDKKVESIRLFLNDQSTHLFSHFLKASLMRLSSLKVKFAKGSVLRQLSILNSILENLEPSHVNDLRINMKLGRGSLQERALINEQKTLLA